MGRRGDWATGRLGDWETGRLGDGETGRRGDGESPSPEVPQSPGPLVPLAPLPPCPPAPLLPTIVMLLLCFLLTSCQLETPPQGVKVKVERVVSGQTVEISNTQGPERLRLLGINAPDWRQEPHGAAAKEKLQQMVEGKLVLLEYDIKTQDNYGRQLGYIWLDGQLVQEVLVRDGYVLAASLWPNTKHEQRLDYAQKWARVQELGIWNAEEPLRLTPAEFRRRQEQQNNS